MPSKPITPGEVAKAKQESFPDEVIDSFNELIAKHWYGHEACFKQKEVVSLIKKKMKLKNTEVIFDNNYLDVEAAYRKAGWSVDYDVYDETFTFSRKK